MSPGAWETFLASQMGAQVPQVCRSWEPDCTPPPHPRAASAADLGGSEVTPSPISLGEVVFLACLTDEETEAQRC